MNFERRLARVHQVTVLIRALEDTTAVPGAAVAAQSTICWKFCRTNFTAHAAFTTAVSPCSMLAQGACVLEACIATWALKIRGLLMHIQNMPSHVFRCTTHVAALQWAGTCGLHDNVLH